MQAALECINARKVFYVKKGAKAESAESKPSAEWRAASGENGRFRGRLPLPRAITTLFSTSVPVEAVAGVTFEVGRGEIFGILGPNGSGKSTLIRLISTLLLPDEGEIRVFGHDVVRERLAVRRLINRVSVEAAFFKKLSAMENLSYAARLYDLDIREARKTAIDILERLRFSRNKAYEPLEDLSRGMQQKVAVARALLTSPRLLLLDEPTTGLDPVSKREVQDYILEVRQARGTTVILTTHDMQEADRLCDRVAIIDQGRFVALDTPAQLKAGLSMSLSTDGGKTANSSEVADSGEAANGGKIVDGGGAGNNGGVVNSSGTVTLENVFFALTGKELREFKLEKGDHGD